MDKIIVIGSSGHAKVVIDIVESEGRFSIAGLIDSHGDADAKVLGYPVIGREEDLPRLLDEANISGVLIAIGDNFVRGKVAARLADTHPSLELVSAVHPKSSIGKDVTIGEGTVIMAGAILNASSVVGRGCIVNTGASLDHDSRMGDYASLGPGCATGGNCRIGAYVAIGIGAIVSHGIAIGDHTVIGAGSTVISNIDTLRVAYGTPAREIRERKSGEKYL
jgi:sugar O-acyltransferase (sialic acid O-acetyltransferase NeuD family)